MQRDVNTSFQNCNIHVQVSAKKFVNSEFTDFVFLHVIIIQQTSKSGRLNSIFLSNRPGRVRAGSRVSGLQNNNNVI